VPKVETKTSESQTDPVKEKVKEIIIRDTIIKEVPTPYEVIKEIQVEVIKEVPVEVIREVIKEVPYEVVKEVVKIVEVEVVREVTNEVTKEVPVV
jgi:surface protein G